MAEKIVICPRCGTQISSPTSFCPNCGIQLAAQVQQPRQYVPPTPQPQLPAKKSNATTYAVIAIVAIVIVAMIAVVALYGTGFGGNTSDNNDGESNNDIVNTDRPVGMVISSVRGYASTNSFSQPNEGNIFMKIAFNITNNAGTEINLNPNYFSILGSDGATYQYSWYVDYTMPDGLANKATTAIVLGFEIPKGMSPASLKFDDYYREKSVSVPSSAIDLTVPEIVHIEVVSMNYSSGEGYYHPDDGNKYVVFEVKFTNKMDITIDRYRLYFDLLTSDGISHELEYGFYYGLPDGIQAGATVNYTFSFEIAESSSPTKLIYDSITKIELDL